MESKKAKPDSFVSGRVHAWFGRRAFCSYTGVNKETSNDRGGYTERTAFPVCILDTYCFLSDNDNILERSLPLVVAW